MSSSAPIYEIDFYCDEVIEDPLPHYAKMRAMGPVVFLPKLGNFALTRHEVIRSALRDHKRFSSSSGVSADKIGSDEQKGNTLASDPPRHTTMRRAMATPLLPSALESIRPQVQAAANTLIDALIDQGEFEAMADLARYLPLTIVRDMVGLPDFGQENMLRWAAAAFNVLGMQNERGQAALTEVREMRAFIQGKLTRETLRPGSWTRRILDLVDRGELDADLAPFVIRDYINPSLDTTISATGELVWQLAQNPDEWQKLRANPELCRNAVNEAVRLGTPIRSFTRTTTTDVDIAGVTIPKGSRVMVLFASANRDERVFPNPDQFDVTRNPKDHVGFGSGIHMCVGMHLAQLEIIALLQAMIPRVAKIEVGDPEVAIHNTIRAFAKLPCRFVADTNSDKTPCLTSRGRASDVALLYAKVVERRDIAKDVVALTLAPAAGGTLPPAEPGAHVSVHVRDTVVRQYSVTGQNSEVGYQIGVQREAEGRGGSIAVHSDLTEGATVTISAPSNNFPLKVDAAEVRLFSGGIGMTPILSMARSLHRTGTPFHWYISARSQDRLPFGDDLKDWPFIDRVSVHLDDQPDTRLNLAEALKGSEPDAHLYVCGPKGYMDAVMTAAESVGWPADQRHQEHFGAEIDTDGEPFQLEARRSGKMTTVAPGETILAALGRLGVAVETSCENGVCGSCLTHVIEGRPDHRDLVQTEVEKAESGRIAVCCSRSQSRRLVLDI